MRPAVLILILLFTTVFTSGCMKEAAGGGGGSSSSDLCEDICEWQEDCFDQDEDDCIDDCEDDMSDMDPSGQCNSEFEEFAECMLDLDCDESGCFDEQDDWEMCLWDLMNDDDDDDDDIDTSVVEDDDDDDDDVISNDYYEVCDMGCWWQMNCGSDVNLDDCIDDCLDSYDEIDPGENCVSEVWDLMDCQFGLDCDDDLIDLCDLEYEDAIDCLDI